jgi:hypothetical protein
LSSPVIDRRGIAYKSNDRRSNQWGTRCARMVQVSGLHVHRMWGHIAVCKLMAMNLSPLAASVGSRTLLLAAGVGSQGTLSVGPSLAVCRPLQLGCNEKLAHFDANCCNTSSCRKARSRIPFLAQWPETFHGQHTGLS